MATFKKLRNGDWGIQGSDLKTGNRTDVGPFSTLTRGVFKTHGEAIAWARENLNGTPYTIKLEGGPDSGAAPPWLSDVAQALGYVRPDGAPMALNWSQALEAIRELRRGRDYWQAKAESK
jgi:hypothetical protein